MNDLRVRDFMTPNVVTVRPDDTIARAHELMLDNRFRHLVVVDADGDLVGLLTHRDLLRYALIERTDLPLSLQRGVLRRILTEADFVRFFALAPQRPALSLVEMAS